MRVVWIIALNTFREIIRDRILYGLVVFALLLIGLSLALGQLSFAEQIRISANFGFTGIHLSAVMLSIFAGGSLVAKEIDKKTILTLLARPISRFQFMLGKSLGLTLVVVSVVTGLALVLAFILMNMGFKLNEGFFLGLFGIILEAIVLLGMALFFSTFSRPIMVASFVLGMFLIGHWLNSLEYFSNKSESGVFKGVGSAIVAVFPNLETFNWRSLAVYGETLEWSVVGTAVVYAFVWYNLLLLAAALVIRKKILVDLFLDHMGVATFVVFLFGAIWGSFANVVIYRLPHEKSVVKPRSRCPKCEAAIKWYDNVPILSWLFLRGRCRSCKAKISWRYPLVEFLMGSVFAIVFYQFGFSWLTLEYLVFAFGLIVVSFIDFDHMILPDVFTLSGVVLGLLGAALNPEREFMSALWGVLMGGGSLYLVAYIYFALRKEEGMGGGDIKLLAWIGALLGWKSIPFVILASSLVGSVVGILIMIRSREGMKAAIPFGPYLALGALIYMIGGSQLIDWYFRLHIPSLGQ